MGPVSFQWPFFPMECREQDEQVKQPGRLPGSMRMFACFARFAWPSAACLQPAPHVYGVAFPLVTLCLTVRYLTIPRGAQAYRLAQMPSRELSASTL